MGRYPVARTKTKLLKPGTIADTVARLALWARLAPRGFARVEYHTEFSRAETDRRLAETLQVEKIPYHRIALPVRRPPSEVMGGLLAQLEALESTVVSITGFATAVSDDAWREFLGHLTWNRERLAGFNHRQVWWMSPNFVDAFIHTVPDLASWFMVRLTIEEEFIPPIEEPHVFEAVQSEGPRYRIDEAMRRATSLIERFRLAKAKNARMDDLLQLAGAAAEATVEVGAPNLTKELSDRLLPGAIAVVQAPNPDRLQTVRTLNRLSGLLISQGLILDAEPLIRRSLTTAEQYDGPDHLGLARELNNLAGFLQVLGRPAEAERLIRRALAIDERNYGPDHPEVADDLNNLAMLLQDMSRLDEAESLSRRSLAITERDVGPNHPEVAEGLNNLAVLLKNMGRLHEAEPIYRRALTIHERVFGPDHPTVARDLDNLAVLLRLENRLSEAESLFRRALEIDERTYGPDHPNVATVLNNLGGVLQATNRLTEAEAAYQRALSLWERSLGRDHPIVASPLNNLAGVLRARSLPTEAEPLLHRVLEILLKFSSETGHEHSNLRNAISNYMGTLQSMGESPEQIRVRLNEIGRPFGMSLGTQFTPR
jgi:tetratricopeptide (TPR) repeat protein